MGGDVPRGAPTAAVERSVDPERFEVRLMPLFGAGQPELLATAGTAGGARLAARTIALESGLPPRRIAIYDTHLERSLTR